MNQWFKDMTKTNMKNIYQGEKSMCCNADVRDIKDNELRDREIFYFVCKKCRRPCHLILKRNE